MRSLNEIIEVNKKHECDDMFKDMFEKQDLLMCRYMTRTKEFPCWPIDITHKGDQKFVRDLLLNSVDELFEASRHLKNWKAHRITNVDDFNREKFLEEMVDAQKYFLEALIMIGITPEEFKQAYDKKDKKCHDRINNGY